MEWKKFSGLGTEILIEASFLLKPIRGSSIEAPHLGTYNLLLIGTEGQVIVSPQHTNLAPRFSHILEIIFISRNTYGLEKFFYRIILSGRNIIFLDHLYQSPYTIE